MRLCLILQDQIEPYLNQTIDKLTNLLTSVIKVVFKSTTTLFLYFKSFNKSLYFIVFKNPSKPNFNHYLFETFGILIRATCLKNRAHIGKFEGNLFPIFNYAIQQDVTGKKTSRFIAIY